MTSYLYQWLAVILAVAVFFCGHTVEGSVLLAAALIIGGLRK